MRELIKVGKEHGKIFVDTNILYNILFKTDLSERALEILEGIEEPVISTIIINELLYVSLRKVAERKFGVKNYRDFRSFIREKGYKPFDDDLTVIMEFLEGLSISIIEDHQDIDELMKVMLSYNLPTH